MTRSAKIRIFRQGASMLFYPAALPLSRRTSPMPPGSSPSPGADRIAELAVRFGIGTAWRPFPEAALRLH
jgi:hypothetical protein